MTAFLILSGIALVLVVLGGISSQLKSINRRLSIIMANQAEFDAQVAALNTKLDGLAEQVTAEAQQIRDFIEANQGSGLDTSALDAIATRLDNLNIAGIFTPPADEEPAPTPEPTED